MGQITTHHNSLDDDAHGMKANRYQNSMGFNDIDWIAMQDARIKNEM